MIYIHSYGIGKFGSKKIRSIHDTYESALAVQEVLGGEIEAFVQAGVAEQIKDDVLDEVSVLIDDLISEELGSPRGMYLDDFEWRMYKSNQLKIIEDILSGKYVKN